MHSAGSSPSTACDPSVKELIVSSKVRDLRSSKCDTEEGWSEARPESDSGGSLFGKAGERHELRNGGGGGGNGPLEGN